MNNGLFGPGYVAQYDLVYREKDYQAECDLLERAFRAHSRGVVRSVLDLGCGTGNHAIPLAQRGYDVTGVDVSSDMLARARAKAKEELVGVAAGNPVFLHGDARLIEVGRRFDAVLMMFGVLGYQLANEDVLCALRAVRKHLPAGGLFICDLWYGPAVLALRPTERVKTVATPEGTLLRASSGTLDTRHHVAEISFRMWRFNGERLLGETVETHKVRYFFPMELAFFMQVAGLELVELNAFPETDRPPDETTWNVFAVARVAEGG